MYKFLIIWHWKVLNNKTKNLVICWETDFLHQFTEFSVALYCTIKSVNTLFLHAHFSVWCLSSRCTVGAVGTYASLRLNWKQTRLSGSKNFRNIILKSLHSKRSWILRVCQTQFGDSMADVHLQCWSLPTRYCHPKCCLQRIVILCNLSS
jgi:hypothetical protein